MNHKNGTRFTLIAESIGQFLLGGILGALAIGMFLRFKHGRVAN